MLPALLPTRQRRVCARPAWLGSRARLPIELRVRFGLAARVVYDHVREQQGRGIPLDTATDVPAAEPYVANRVAETVLAAAEPAVSPIFTDAVAAP